MTIKPSITGLNGVILISSNYAEQVAFYRDIMGFKVTASASDATFFQCGNQVFAIFAKGHHPEGDASLDGANHGISHLEFCLDARDIEAMTEKLRKSNAHAYRDVFHDADGNLFHFVS